MIAATHACDLPFQELLDRVVLEIATGTLDARFKHRRSARVGKIDVVLWRRIDQYLSERNGGGAYLVVECLQKFGTLRAQTL